VVTDFCITMIHNDYIIQTYGGDDELYHRHLNTGNSNDSFLWGNARRRSTLIHPDKYN